MNKFLILTSLLVLSIRSWAAPVGFLKLQHNSYISSGQPYFRSSAEANASNISLNLNGHWFWRNFTFNVQGRDEYASAEGWNYLSANELNVSYAVSDRTSFTVGRKIYQWSEWEGQWRQGLFQPRYLYNKLYPEIAGLTGVFADFGIQEFKVTIGALLHHPDLGTHFFVRDHSFYSTNPWFNPPASNFVYNSRLQDIRYSIAQPSAADVINNPGLAAKMEWRRENQLVRLSYAYKPMPQFLLGFASRNQVIIGSEADYMRVHIQPRVLYHKVIGADYVTTDGVWTFSGSAAHEVPDADPVSESFMAQRAGPAWIYSAQLGRPIEEDGPLAARFTVGFLKVIGGDERDQGDFASDKTLFERRYQYNEALMLTLSKPIRGFVAAPVDLRSRIIYDRLQNGAALSVGGVAQLDKSFRIELDADFLGLLGREAEIKDNFFSSYRANDRIGVGMSYVF